jgi:hypothetical protein
MQADRKQYTAVLNGELLALIYMGVIAFSASKTGLSLLLFPELSALSRDVFTRARGKWASQACPSLWPRQSPRSWSIRGASYKLQRPGSYIDCGGKPHSHQTPKIYNLTGNLRRLDLSPWYLRGSKRGFGYARAQSHSAYFTS